MDLLDLLLQAGVTVQGVGDWRPRRRPGPFDPIGIMNHHTACPDRGNAPSLKVCTEGRRDARGHLELAGPLCHLLVGRDGTAYLIAGENARCNHAGRGSSVVLREAMHGIAPSGDAATRGLQDDADGNSWFFGIEVENDGQTEAYPPEQLQTLIRINAAICRWKGWTEARVIHHREWTSRKPDMSWRGDLRGAVRELLDQQPSAGGSVVAADAAT